MYKISRHGKLRLLERTHVDRTNIRNLFNSAIKNGSAPNNMKKGKIRDFLLSKERYNSKVKLYKGYVFVYSKNNKRLYTVYKLPKELEGGRY